MTQTYRSGPRKGLPKQCECGGKMLYQFSFGMVFSVCAKCTPVVKVKAPTYGVKPLTQNRRQCGFPARGCTIGRFDEFRGVRKYEEFLGPFPAVLGPLQIANRPQIGPRR